MSEIECMFLYLLANRTFFLELPIYSFPYVSNKLNKLSTYKNSLYIKENSPFLSAHRL